MISWTFPHMDLEREVYLAVALGLGVAVKKQKGMSFRLPVVASCLGRGTCS